MQLDELHAALTDPAHIARLAADPNQWLPPEGPELRPWRGGIPDQDRDRAKALWQRWSEELAGGTADNERSYQFYRLTRALVADAPNAERAVAFADAAGRVSDLDARSALYGAASANFLEDGQRDRAREMLAHCEPSERRYSDSVVRQATAHLAISDGRPADALALLGETADAIPVLRNLASMYAVARVQALTASGDAARGAAMLRQLAEDRGFALVNAIIDNLPADWRFDRGPVDQRFRDIHARKGRFWFWIGIYMLPLAAAALLAGLSQKQRGIQDHDPWLICLFASPSLLGLGLLALIRGRRRRRIAESGVCGTGTVVGRVGRGPGGGAGGWRSTRFGLALAVDATGPNGETPPPQCTSLRSMSREAAAKMKGDSLRVIWHPELPGWVLGQL